MERCPGERGGPAAVAGEMERGPGEGSGPAAVAGATLRALGACQRRLLTLARRAGCEVLRVERRYGELRRPHLQRRGRLIEHIPGFWVTAFLNHPQLSALIDENDEEVFNYMMRLEVEEFEDIKSGYRIKFHFNDNPYFENRLVIKEFHLGTGGRPVSQSTPIKWKPGMELTSEVKEPGTLVHHHGPPRSFFCWFSEHRNPTTDHIAEVLKDDMWPNPLQYFLVADSESGENGLEDSDEENGGDSVVIVDGDDEDDDIQEILEDDEGSDDDVEEIEEDVVELVGQVVEAKEGGDG